MPPDHHRQSIRLKDYDYTQPGGYMVTLVAYHRETLFGTIQGERVCRSAVGEMVAQHWLKLPDNFAVELDEWMLMPDHFHGIIIIQDTRSTPTLQEPRPYPNGTQPGSLGAIIQGFKASTTRIANKMMGTPQNLIWQRNFYEHVIRNEDDMENARRYIHENPIQYSLKEEQDWWGKRI